MGLAKKLRKPPRVIAQAIVDNLDGADAPASASIAGPGFINLAVKPEWLAAELASAGVLPDIGKARKHVEYKETKLK